MKQTLQLRLSQHLTLTPQLQQSIRLLQLSTLELNQELERFLAENPLLEREDTPEDAYVPHQDALRAEQPAPSQEPAQERDQAQASGDLDWSSAPPASRSDRDDDDGDFRQAVADLPTLRDHLLDQLGLMQLGERDRRLAEMLVDALDEDGYLTQTLEELHAMLPEELDVDPDELRIALRHIQHLDPVGVGARDASECLGLQLAAMPESTVGRDVAMLIARDHLPLLAARDFQRLRKFLRCGDNALREAHHLIQRLNPRPGAAFAQPDTRYVVPDVVVRKVKSLWLASLNPDAMPKLRIHRMYADILQGNRGGGPMAQQLQEARWLIKNVQQRFDTILRVSQCIVDRQRHFFEHGEVAMRPLVLREIADALGLHESTVSRVTTQKYMLTPRGIFELKYFFGSHVATEAGGACSATAIRALIKQLVGAEDGSKPLSDSRISQILGQQGIMVARRTIAKYRESLQIPPVNMRKSL